MHPEDTTHPPEAMRNGGGGSAPKSDPPGQTFVPRNPTVRNHQGSHPLVVSPLLEDSAPGKPLDGSGSSGNAIPFPGVSFGPGGAPGRLGQAVEGSKLTAGDVSVPMAGKGRVAVPAAPVEPLEAFEVSSVRLVQCKTAEEWLEANTPALLEAGARLAMSGRDPMFRSQFFGKILDYQREVVSAKTKAKGHVLGKALEVSEERKMLIAAAEEVEGMDPGDLMASLRSAGEGE